MKLLLIPFLFIASLSLSQDYGKEIQKILQDFSVLDAYSLKAKVVVSGNESYAFDASIRSCKYGSHTLTDVVEMIVNKNYAIAIDHEDKTIRVDKGDFTGKSKGKSDVGLEMIDQMINESGSIEYLGSTAEYRTYVVYHDSAISKTVVKINNKTNFFHEIEVFYESEDVSISSYKVTYQAFEKNPAYKKDDFNEKQVIKVDANGNFVPVGKYSDYTVIKQY